MQFRAKSLRLAASNRLTVPFCVVLAAAVGCGYGATLAHFWDPNFEAMDWGRFVIPLLFLLPLLFVGIVWWSWTKARHEGKRWRRTATLISATTTSGNSIVMAGLVTWGNISTVAPATAHHSLVSDLVLLGAALSVASIIVVPFGAGRVRWFIVPAAVVQFFTWSLLAQITNL